MEARGAGGALFRGQALCGAAGGQSRCLQRQRGGPGREETVTGYAQLIDEMITNLCDNAIKYNCPAAMSA